MHQLIEKIRTWRAFRRERRTRTDAARKNALYLALGGTLTVPAKKA